MRRALELDCDFYFVADVDNFIRPATLRELVALDLPIASPLLRSIAPGQYLFELSRRDRRQRLLQELRPVSVAP